MQVNCMGMGVSICAPKMGNLCRAILNGSRAYQATPMAARLKVCLSPITLARRRSRAGCWCAKPSKSPCMANRRTSGCRLWRNSGTATPASRSKPSSRWTPRRSSRRCAPWWTGWARGSRARLSRGNPFRRWRPLMWRCPPLRPRWQQSLIWMLSRLSRHRARNASLAAQSSTLATMC